MESGPCIKCGKKNYPLSMGGSGICPSCDCGLPPVTHSPANPNVSVGEFVLNSDGANGGDLLVHDGDGFVKVQGKDDKKLERMQRVIKAAGLCKHCPERYQALTKGYKCCLEMED